MISTVAMVSTVATILTAAMISIVTISLATISMVTIFVLRISIVTISVHRTSIATISVHRTSTVTDSIKTVDQVDRHRKLTLLECYWMRFNHFAVRCSILMVSSAVVCRRRCVNGNVTGRCSPNYRSSTSATAIGQLWWITGKTPRDISRNWRESESVERQISRIERSTWVHTMRFATRGTDCIIRAQRIFVFKFCLNFRRTRTSRRDSQKFRSTLFALSSELLNDVQRNW